MSISAGINLNLNYSRKENCKLPNSLMFRQKSVKNMIDKEQLFKTMMQINSNKMSPRKKKVCFHLIFKVEYVVYSILD